ncbi:MAG: hypothetical protein M9962_12140 [Oligoflexia bacterium]|nr:hypothetical protein [Oligoflexia bacterium]
MKSTTAVFALLVVGGVGFASLPKDNSPTVHYEELKTKKLPFLQTTTRDAANDNNKEVHFFTSETQTARVQKKNPLDNKDAAKHWNRIRAGSACFSHGVCPKGLPDSDPMERSIFARDMILTEIDWFLDKQATSKQQISRVTLTGQKLLRLDDEQIQIKSLDLLRDYPVNGKTVEILSEIAPDFVDPALVRKTILEFSRHTDARSREIAMNTVERLIFEGGIYASREAAKSATLLYSPETASRFEDWIRRMPSTSAKQKLLIESLNIRITRGLNQ